MAKDGDSSDHGGNFVPVESPFRGDALLEELEADGENLTGQLLSEEAKRLGRVRTNRRPTGRGGTRPKLTEIGPIFEIICAGRVIDGDDFDELIKKSTEHVQAALR